MLGLFAISNSSIVDAHVKGIRIYDGSLIEILEVIKGNLTGNRQATVVAQETWLVYEVWRYLMIFRSHGQIESIISTSKLSRRWKIHEFARQRRNAISTVMWR